jgi:hypothetical protein
VFRKNKPTWLKTRGPNFSFAESDLLMHSSAAFKCDYAHFHTTGSKHATAVEIYIASKFITGLNSLLHKPWSDNSILQNGTE